MSTFISYGTDEESKQFVEEVINSIPLKIMSEEENKILVGNSSSYVSIEIKENIIKTKAHLFAQDILTKVDNALSSHELFELVKDYNDIKKFKEILNDKDKYDEYVKEINKKEQVSANKDNSTSLKKVNDETIVKTNLETKTKNNSNTEVNKVFNKIYSNLKLYHGWIVFVISVIFTIIYFLTSFINNDGTFSISEMSQNIWAMFVSLILSIHSGIIGLLIKARNKNTNIKTKGTGFLISLSFFHAFIALYFIIFSFVF